MIETGTSFPRQEIHLPKLSFQISACDAILPTDIQSVSEPASAPLSFSLAYLSTPYMVVALAMFTKVSLKGLAYDLHGTSYIGLLWPCVPPVSSPLYSVFQLKQISVFLSPQTSLPAFHLAPSFCHERPPLFLSSVSLFPIISLPRPSWVST